jgi:hypothetical protein
MEAYLEKNRHQIPKFTSVKVKELHTIYLYTHLCQSMKERKTVVSMESRKQKAVLTCSKKGGKHISHYCAVIQQGPHLSGDSTPQPTQLQFCTACDTIMTTVYQQQCSDTRTAEHNSNVQLCAACTCTIYVILHKCSQQG